MKAFGETVTMASPADNGRRAATAAGLVLVALTVGVAFVYLVRRRV